MYENIFVCIPVGNVPMVGALVNIMDVDKCDTGIFTHQ